MNQSTTDALNQDPTVVVSDSYKKEFLDFLYEIQALRLDSDYKLKNNRFSPFFINMGEFNHGSALKKLGEAFATQIISSRLKFDVLFGPAYKGIPIVIATAVSLSEKGAHADIAFNRKEAKTHGEIGENKNSQKAWIVGREIREHDRIILLDDVLTTAETKYETIEFLKKIAPSAQIMAVIIAVDRQEVGVDGQNAIAEFVSTTGIPVIPVINGCDIFRYLELKKEISSHTLKRIKTYMSVYGTKELKNGLGNIPNQTIITESTSIIPACDVPTIEEYEELIKQTSGLERVGGYKIGFELALRYGLPELTARARAYTNKPLIYDHQKAGTDIPEKGKEFASVCKKSGIDTVILFPQAGPETERAWIYYAWEQGLNVIIGGIMTHKAYLVNEGGFISNEGAMNIYKIAAQCGINNFVVPATKLDVIKNVKELIEAEGITPTFYAPGFFAQGGTIEGVKQVAGERIHVIVGREINRSADKKQAALEIINKL